MSVRQHHVTQMRIASIHLEVTVAHVIQDTLEMDKHAQTSMNVHRAWIIVMPMQAVRIRLGVSPALAIPVITEAEPAVQILMNVLLSHHVT